MEISKYQLSSEENVSTASMTNPIKMIGEEGADEEILLN
jgi:hypothetical protein